ncbi:hypothetical protein BN946_scf184983.g53 [Trametes cinnabarina]|uniref:Fungal-type protein kinase domain-containing protein n=1 Tax=Pycnoporus cinnabarinus TaxID=5643 RepID=A0A060SDX2_PYCCI|nr:hypothetical protein BN946_scf184983.g53 [Trametes cinnabarina]
MRPAQPFVRSPHCRLNAFSASVLPALLETHTGRDLHLATRNERRGSGTTFRQDSRVTAPHTAPSPEQIFESPRPAPPTIGMFENLSASRNGPHGVSASHGTVQAELVDKVQLNDDTVLRRLKIDTVSSDIVQLCQQKLEEGGAVYRQVKALQNMARRADRMTVAQLEREAEEEQHDYDDELSDSEAAQATPNVKKSRRERNMYEPLEAIFDAISSVPTGPDEAPEIRPKRCFRNQTEVPIPDQDHTLGYPRFIPDFSLLEDPSLRSSKLWSDRAGFIEVKASSQQRPEVDVGKREVSRILTQVANYASLHLSARPFSVFSVSIMIFGCDFCVAIFDRGGAQVSPIYDMFCNSDTFIRVIRSVTRVLGDAELGRDPSVSLAPVPLSSSSGGPAWIVDAVGSDKRRWCTTGPAIWSSLSLFGRATAVWPVREIKDNKLVGGDMILKSTWRSSDRDPESFVYQNINGSHPGLAKFITGGDAVFPYRSDKPEAITVHSLRGVPVSRGERTKVLHRLLIESVGKPVWEYQTDRELLEGLIGALKAHRFLSEQNILHRDVSAGNVLLALDPEQQGTAGFLTDLEYARMGAVITRTRQETVEAPTAYGPVRADLREPMQRTHTTFVVTQRGAGISGTLQFMSRRLLAALMSGQQSVTTTVQDDVESFLWVLLYAVLRRLVMVHLGENQERQRLKTAFCNAFGGMSLQTIYDSRISSHTLDIWALPLVEDLTSWPMRLIFQKYVVSFNAQRENDIAQHIASRLQGASRSPLLEMSRKSKKLVAADFSYDGMLGTLERSLQLLKDSPELDIKLTLRKR